MSPLGVSQTCLNGCLDSDFRTLNAFDLSRRKVGVIKVKTSNKCTACEWFGDRV